MRGSERSILVRALLGEADARAASCRARAASSMLGVALGLAAAPAADE